MVNGKSPDVPALLDPIAVSSKSTTEWFLTGFDFATNFGRRLKFSRFFSPSNNSLNPCDGVSWQFLLGNMRLKPVSVEDFTANGGVGEATVDTCPEFWGTDEKQ